MEIAAMDFLVNRGKSREFENSMIVVLSGGGDDGDYRRLFRVQQVRDAMAQLLTSRQFDYLALSMDGISQNGVAKLYGVEPSTVSHTIARAKARLARYLYFGLLPRLEVDTLRYITENSRIHESRLPQ